MRMQPPKKSPDVSRWDRGDVRKLPVEPPSRSDPRVVSPLTTSPVPPSATIPWDEIEASSPRPKTSPAGKARASFAFGWTRQVALDGDLLPGSYRLAIVAAQELTWDDEAGGYRISKAQMWFKLAMDVSRASIQAWFGDLVAHGHLDVVVRKGRGITNIYRPRMKPKTVAEAPRSADADDPPVTSDTEPPAADPPPHVASAVGPDERDASPDVDEDEPLAEPLAAQYDLDGLFMQFWTAFPWRAGDGSEAIARAEFRRRIKAGVDPTTIVSQARLFARQQGADYRTSPSRATGAQWLTRQDWGAAKAA